VIEDLALSNPVIRSHYGHGFAKQKCIGALWKIVALLAHADRQPVVLVEADSCGKRESGRHAYEHPAPMRIVHIEVELGSPALLLP
jgi:hypothetical protein